MPSSNSVYSNQARQSRNTYSSDQHGVYSTLVSDQVYNKDGKTGGVNPYTNNGTQAYAKNQNWDKAKIYREQQNQANLGSEIPIKYKRFNDLKILNEQIINLSNNMQPEESPLEVLSQGQKGEIKNLLWSRIWKISFAPALSAIVLNLVVMFGDFMIATLFAFAFYIYVIGRTFFYPAKLYYENIQHKTTRHAKLFFEEMDFWYKMSVVKILAYMIFVIIATLVLAIYEDAIVDFMLTYFVNTSRIKEQQLLINYLSNISFSGTFVFLSLIYLLTIVAYFKFINQEKAKNEALLKVKLKNIRNQTMSRVEQIQADKNELENV